MSSVIAAVGGLPRVNLMPRTEVARRERDGLIRRWLWGVLAALVVAVLIIAGGLYLKWSADQRLLAEQAKSNQLVSELAALSEVSQAIAAEQELLNFRSESMGADFAWTPVLAAVAGSLPADAALTGFDLIGGGVPQGEDSAAETGLIGTISVGSSNPVDIVAAVRKLRTVPGVLTADGQSVTESSVVAGNYAYQLTVEFDQSIYSGEFARDEVSE